MRTLFIEIRVACNKHKGSDECGMMNDETVSGVPTFVFAFSFVVTSRRE
jgi:hypothetical protein